MDVLVQRTPCAHEGRRKTIAVPTAEVDANARNERLKYWFDLGMNVLNVAAFFVPGLNTVMLGVLLTT